MMEYEHIEDILEENGLYIGTTAGVSMYPMLRNRRDTVIITRTDDRLNVYDVPLYKRGTQYVLHRIVEVRPDSYVIIGDNCITKEYVKDDQILGVLTGFYRGEKQIDMQGKGYRVYTKIWCALYPVRVAYKKLRHWAVQLVKGEKRNGPV